MFEAWIDLLLNANHSEQEVILGNEVYICKRGQQLRSLETLSKKWHWSRSRVRRVLHLFAKCSMIVLKPEHKTTQITICNYDKYQSERNKSVPDSETRMKHERYTNNNDDNEPTMGNSFFSEKVNFFFNKFLEEQKKPISEPRIITLVENLEKLAPYNDDLKIEIIKQAIAGGHKDFRPLPVNKVKSATAEELTAITCKHFSPDSPYYRSKETVVPEQEIKWIPPTEDEVAAFFEENGYSRKSGNNAWFVYNKKCWKANGEIIEDWKASMRLKCFIPKNKIHDNQR